MTIRDSDRATRRSTGRSMRASLVATVLTFVALLVLAGCGSSDSTPAQASGPSGVELPKDFPTDQIPLINGAVLSAGGSADEGWNLTVQGPADTTAAALDSAVKTLTDGGFKEVQRTTDGGNQVVVVTASKGGKNYTVEVGSVAGAAGGPNSVFYQVSAA